MSEIKQYKIEITIGAKVIPATLYDNATTRDFLQLLPTTIELRDYSETEKAYDLPKKLTTSGAPPGTDPDPGDIAYYAPWGNLAIFYKDFGYSKGLIKLGRIDGSIDIFKTSGSLRARIEVTKKE